MSTPEQAMANRLSDEDLALLTPAVKEAETAQAVVGYLMRHLAPRYGLVNGDVIENDGTIKRANNG